MGKDLIKIMGEKKKLLKSFNNKSVKNTILCISNGMLDIILDNCSEESAKLRSIK